MIMMMSDDDGNAILFHISQFTKKEVCTLYQVQLKEVKSVMYILNNLTSHIHLCHRNNEMRTGGRTSYSIKEAKLRNLEFNYNRHYLK